MIKFFKWIVKGRLYIDYEGYHCGCCGCWENEKFSIPTYKSNGEWADTWGLCNECKKK